eukprot:scaffold6566_cov125-Amphora_coffeaeformis.AAC.5
MIRHLLAFSGRQRPTGSCMTVKRCFAGSNIIHKNSDGRHHAVLRVHGPDRKGIVAAVSQVLDRYGCAITQSEQWTDMNARLFFQRVEFTNSSSYYSSSASSFQEGFSDEQQQCIHQGLQQATFDLQHIVNWRQRKPRLAIFVSKYDHCLWELLLRHEAGELDCEIAMVISNHEALRYVATTFHIPFYAFRITADSKQAQEDLQIQLLKEMQVDLVVLARYMQVLSTHFLQNFPSDHILNIHHSFLPAFAGELLSLSMIRIHLYTHQIT